MSNGIKEDIDRTIIQQNQRAAHFSASLVGQRAEKVGGSYQATGTIVGDFTTNAGKRRVVFEFDAPTGMLHIFDPAQLILLEQSPAFTVAAS